MAHLNADRQRSRHSHGACPGGGIASAIGTTGHPSDRRLELERQGLALRAWRGAPHCTAWRAASLGLGASGLTRMSLHSPRGTEPTIHRSQTLTQIEREGEHRLSCRPPCEFRRLLFRVFHTTLCLPLLSDCATIARAGTALHIASFLSTAIFSLPPASLHPACAFPFGIPAACYRRVALGESRSVCDCTISVAFSCCLDPVAYPYSLSIIWP